MSDMEDDIRAAMAEVSGNASEPAPVEEVVVAPEAIITEAETPQDDTEKANDGRERGPDGKFIAKQPETVQDTPDQPLKVETPQESIRPPASWTPASKAKFATLDPDIQKEILKRETDVEKGFRERSQREKAFEPLEQLIAPRRAQWAAQGMDEASAIKTLLAAQDLLEQDPRKGLEFLARSYGVSLNTAQPQGQPYQAQPSSDSHPEIATLKQQLQVLQSQVQEAQTAPIKSQIEAFFNDPANIYAENVRPEMALLLSNGQAGDLPEAYAKACRMRDDIWPLLQPAPAALSGHQMQDKAAQARRAAVSVTGSPGKSPIPKSNGSIEDDIRAAFQEVAGSA
jgi:hypothetical protein